MDRCQGRVVWGAEGGDLLTDDGPRLCYEALTLCLPDAVPISQKGGRRLLKDLKENYKQVGLAVPEEYQRTGTDAKNAGYLREYEEASKLLSKFVHPTPLVLFSPPIDSDELDTLRTCFFIKAVKYVHTIYCLAAEQSGYNPAEIDLAGQLAQLRTELAQ